MLNPIDSFFQYFVKRMFSISCFSAKRMPYMETIGECCFISCLAFVNFLVFKKIIIVV